MNFYNEHDPNAAAWLRELIKENLIPPGDVDERDIQNIKPNELERYTQCHFFAGIGGWPLALRLAGWPDDKEVWTGSCPCQPFSVAGKRKGKNDERDLWTEFYRLIEAVRPPVVFGEQVASADVIGSSADADLFSMWTPEAIVRISERLKGKEISSLQRMREEIIGGISENQAEARQGKQEMESQEPRVAIGFLGKGSREREGVAIRNHIQGDTRESGCGVVRSNGYSVQPVGTPGLELPFIGSDRARQRLYAREYQSSDLCLQRDGERLGRAENSGSLEGHYGSKEAELERLIREAVGEAQAEDRFEWITRLRADVAGCGYTFGACILPAACVGSPHPRQRLFWVADAGHQRAGRSAGPREAKIGRALGNASGCGEQFFRLVNSGGLGAGNKQQIQLAKSASGNGAWSDCEIIGFTDGKSRRSPKFKSRIIRLADGFFYRLDNVISELASEAIIEVIAYAKKSGTNPSEVLRMVQCEVRKDALCSNREEAVGAIGGTVHLQEEAILFDQMRNILAAPTQPAVVCGSVPEANETLQFRMLRDLRIQIKAECSPLRRGPTEQCEGKPSDSLPSLSQFLARCCEKSRDLSSRADASTLPTIEPVKGRNAMLRGYGNAIVPQVAAEFILAYLET